MMAYDNQFVLCVLHDNSPVREINGKVTLPFHSEYKLRLKNKHSYLRAKARVWIDGRKVSNLGDFIISPGQTLDLERFLDESMSSGNRFKFVPLSDGRVNDPTDVSNGVVKVEFYREVDYLNQNWQFTISPNPSYPENPPWPRRGTGAIPLTYDSYSNMTIGQSVSVNCFNAAPQTVRSLAPTSAAAPGATVEGSRSGQNFAYGQDFNTETFPVTLTLTLQGVNRIQNNPEPYTISPKPAGKSKERFCSNCGARRRRMSDSFCARCGHPFQKRSPKI